MRVLVTGANGFIGSHLCELLKQQNYQVRALVRKTSNLKWIEKLGLELIYGDLREKDSLINAVNGVEVVFHTAAVLRPKDKNDFLQVNYQGTELLARVSAKAGVRRFILFSSVAAAGPVGPEEKLTEDREPRPVSEYGKAKLAAEQAVLGFKDLLNPVILRFPAVYGPRDRDGLIFWRMLSKGVAPVLGGTFSLIYVTDAVRAAVLSATVMLPTNRDPIYFISDGVCYTFYDLVREWERITGKRVFTFRVPSFLGFFAARVNFWLAREGTVFNPDKMKELTQQCWVCSDERANAELGFKPSVPLNQGAEITLKWYQEAGWL